jgi:hypothetical protein
MDWLTGHWVMPGKAASPKASESEDLSALRPSGASYQRWPRAQARTKKEEKVKRVTFAVVFAVFCLPSSLAAANQDSPDAKALVQVRVVTWKGQILADRPVVARTTTVPTSRRATCFGGSPTDGFRRLEGTTALGALQRATAGIRGLRPLLLTNAFDFGLGLCAVGDFAPTGEEWWALKVNGVLSTTGGDSTFLKRGDRVLWYLDQSFNAAMPEELRLSAPATVRRGGLASVRVWAVNGAGRFRPAEGARVRAGGRFIGTTDAVGRISVRIRSRTRVVARMGGFIASNRSLVQVKADSPRRTRAVRGGPGSGRTGA